MGSAFVLFIINGFSISIYYQLIFCKLFLGDLNVYVREANTTKSCNYVVIQVLMSWARSWLTSDLSYIPYYTRDRDRAVLTELLRRPRGRHSLDSPERLRSQSMLNIKSILFDRRDRKRHADVREANPIIQKNNLF